MYVVTGYIMSPNEDRLSLIDHDSSIAVIYAAYNNM